MTARITAWILAALAVFLAWSIAGMQIAAGLLLLSFLLDRQAWSRAREVRLPCLVFAGMCILSVALSPAPKGSFDVLAWRTSLLTWITAAVVLGLPELAVRRAMVGWVAAIGLASCWGIVQVFTGKDLLFILHLRKAPFSTPVPANWPDHFTALGFFNSRLTFAHGVLIPLAVAGAYALLGRGRMRWLAGLAAALLGVALLLTFARAAYWGALAAAAILLLRARSGLRAMLVVGAVLACSVLAVPSIRARFATSVKVSANEDRVFIWDRAREVIHDHPVFGVGFDAYPQVARPYYDRVDPKFPMHTWAHDTPLSLLAETGPAGLAAYAWLWVTVFWLGWRGIRAGSTLALGLFAGVLGLHVAALFHDVLYDGEVAHALYFAAGLLAAEGLRVPRAAQLPDAPSSPEVEESPRVAASAAR